MTTVHPGDEITYTDRAGVTHWAVATTGLRGSPDRPTVYVLDGAQVHELPANKLAIHGHPLTP